MIQEEKKFSKYILPEKNIVLNPIFLFQKIPLAKIMKEWYLTWYCQKDFESMINQKQIM